MCWSRYGYFYRQIHDGAGGLHRVDAGDAWDYYNDEGDGAVAATTVDNDDLEHNDDDDDKDYNDDD